MNIMSLLEKVYKQQRFPAAVMLQGQQAEVLDFVHSFTFFLSCELHQRCGICSSCCLFLANNHPDIETVAPLEKGHAIKIDQVRELQSRAYQTPRHLSEQWMIIHQADTMNENSCNALLKFLEEPSLKTHFILTVENKNLLPKTILSRCWQFELLPQTLNRLPACSPEILSIENVFLEDLQRYLDEQIDLSFILKRLDGFLLDDVLCFLQYISYLMVQKFLIEKKTDDLAMVVAIPLSFWWVFWDRALYYRKQLRLGTHYQTQLLLSRLFLILKGNI
jgi:DNA polymerase III, delta subunit